MASKLKAIFSRGTKAKPDSDPKPSYTTLQDSSDSIYSDKPIDAAEEKRKAWEAKKEKEAEEWLWKQGFGQILPPIRI